MPRGWWSRDDLPPELQNMDPKDLVEAVKKSKESDGVISGLRDELKNQKTAFETFTSEFDTKLDAKLQELGSKLPAKQEPPPTEVKPNFTDFLVDPDKAFAERLAVGIQPVAAVALQNAAYTAKNSVRDKLQRAQRGAPGRNFDGYFFEKYETEIDALAARIPATQLGNPETWEHLFYNIKGRHADEIAAQVKDGKAEFLIEVGTTPRLQERQDNGDVLTDQEKKIAAKLGQTEADFLKQKKAINSSAIGVNI